MCVFSLGFENECLGFSAGLESRKLDLYWEFTVSCLGPKKLVCLYIEGCGQRKDGPKVIVTMFRKRFSREEFGISAGYIKCSRRTYNRFKKNCILPLPGSQPCSWHHNNNNNTNL